MQHYIDKVSRYIPECVDNLEKVCVKGRRDMYQDLFLSCADPPLQVCMLLNNLQALRVNVQTLFEGMGGAEVSI